MADIKRMNFFDRQFLRARDFQDEQAYHLDQRRRHNRLLHTPGVAEGLLVTRVNASTVRVTGGTALDPQGRVIILSAERLVSIPSGANATKMQLRVAYGEVASDPSADPGVTGQTRMTEAPSFSLLKTLPEPADTPPPDSLLLAEITLTGGQVTEVNNDVRSPAGARGAIDLEDMTLRSLTLRREDVAQSQWPKLSCSELGGISFLTGTPSTEKVRIIANGNVGVGTQAPGARLHVSGGAVLLDNNQGVFLKNTSGADKRALLADASNVLHIGGGGGLGFDRIDFDLGNAGLVMTAVGGNIGIGTPAPDRKLTIAQAGAATGVFENIKNGAHEILFGVDNTAIVSAMTASDLQLRTNNAPRVVIQANTGNVGIGLNSPLQKLHVAGGFMRVDGVGNEQVYIGGDGAGKDVQLGSFNPTVTNVALWNATTNTRMDLFARNIIFTGNLTGGGKGGYVMDQFINALDEVLEEGDVVVIGANQSSHYYGQRDNIPIPEVDLAQSAYDTSVCGIVCEVYGELQSRSESDQGKKSKEGKKTRKSEMRPQAFTPAELDEMGRAQVQPGQIGWMVTLGAFAHCKVDADIAPIKVGDLLTTSPTKGHAQKALDPGKAIGAIVAKALGPLKKGKGKIPVLVILQ